jgi:hypothetical protein
MRESEQGTGQQHEDVNSIPVAPTPTIPEPTIERASPEEAARIKQRFDEARQRVKPLIKREAEAEILTDDVLNFRLSMR